MAMVDEYRLLPECYADTLLMHMLGFRNPNHQFGKGTVAKAMKNERKNKLTIGVVDQDKGESAKYFEEFELIKSVHDLQYYKHATNQHHIIVICPVLEKWILKICEDESIDLKTYNLPDHHRKLGPILKDINVDKNQKVKNFFNTLHQKNPLPIEQLRTWIESILSGQDIN